MKAACLLVLLVAAWLPAYAQVLSEAESRERLAARRAAIEAAHAVRERECAERFFVTGCLEAARTRRRESLTEIGLSEATLDDAERSRRAGARLQRIDDKRARQEADQRQRAAVPLLPPEAASAAVRPGVRSAPPRPAAALNDSSPAAADPARRRLDEQRARAAYDARQRDALQRRDALARRQAQKQQDGKSKAAPLPPVPPGSAP